MNAKKTAWLFILGLATIKFALPFFLQHPIYELHRDEFLYLEQGNHLAWGYMEVPPMLSWLAKITHWLGGSFFWVKFWPSFFGALTLIVTCRMVKELGGGYFAIFIAGLSIMFTSYLRIHFLFQANFLDIFWWSLASWFIIRFINSNQIKYLYLVGIALGFGWLAKNSVSFFAIGFTIALLLTPYRRLYANKHLYGAALLAFIIALPNIIWQYNHNWPLLHHMNELRETQLRYINPADFLAGQLLMSIPAFFIWIMGLVWLFKKTNKAYRILAWIFLSILIVLILTSGKNYYALGAYPMLYAAGAVALQQWTLNRFKWLKYAAAIVILFLAWVVVPMALPIWEPGKLASFYAEKNLAKTGLLKWEDQQNHSLPQDFADYLGWKEMTQKTETFFNSLPAAEQSKTIVFCRHYGQAGALIYYGKEKKFREKVITDHGSFLHWIPDQVDFKNILFVGGRLPRPDDEVFQHFEKVTVIDVVSYKHARQLGDKIVYFEKIDSTGLRIAREGLNRRKQQFNQ